MNITIEKGEGNLMALYEDEYIVIKQRDMSEINTMFAGAGVQLRLELKNVSEEPLRVSAVDITANGVTVEKSELLEGELRPGKRSYSDVHFYYKSFPDGKIKKLDDIKDITFGVKYEIGDTGVKKINGPVSVEV